MHRRLVFEDPLSGAALWSRRLAWFAFAVMALSLLQVRLRGPSPESLAPVAASYVFVALSLLLAGVAFVGIWRHGYRGVGIAGGATLVCLLLLAPAFYVGFRMATRPALTDLSTDLEDPPGFSRSQAVLAARGGRQPPDIPAEQRRLQRRAYPKTAPILLDIPAEAAFEIARKAAGTLGWEVLEASKPPRRDGAGRIEAVSRGKLLHFAEDITIRVRARAEGSRIDIRSASRLGGHDLGANAARIAGFASEVDTLMESR